MDNENNTNTTVDSSNSSLDQKIDDGFAQNNQRFDQIVALMQDHYTGETEQLNQIMLVSAENNEEQEQEESEQISYETVLSDISNQLELQNNLIVGGFFMLGVLTGVLLFRILWDRLRG